LNSRNKHGISSPEKINLLEKELQSYKRRTDSDAIEASVIYEDKFIEQLLKDIGVKVPDDPFTRKWDFSSLRNEAAQMGFVPFSSLSEEVERILNFRDFFLESKVREQRTFNQWVRDSKRFWRRVFNGKTHKARAERARLAEIGKSSFVSIADLEKKITRSFSGWIFVFEDRFNNNLLNSGPSLRVTFEAGNVSSRKISSYNTGGFPVTSESLR
jgi:hypothetical protein